MGIRSRAEVKGGDVDLASSWGRSWLERASLETTQGEGTQEEMGPTDETQSCAGKERHQEQNHKGLGRRGQRMTEGSTEPDAPQRLRGLREPIRKIFESSTPNAVGTESKLQWARGEWEGRKWRQPTRTTLEISR